MASELYKFDFKHAIYDNEIMSLQLKSEGIISFEELKTQLQGKLNAMSIKNEFIIITKTDDSMAVCDSQSWNVSKAKNCDYFKIKFIPNNMNNKNNNNSKTDINMNNTDSNDSKKNNNDQKNSKPNNNNNNNNNRNNSEQRHQNGNNNQRYAYSRINSNNINNNSNNNNNSNKDDEKQASNEVNEAVWNFNIKNACYDNQVQSLISKKYNNIGKMWKLNPTALLSTLQEMAMIGYSRVDTPINFSQTGYNDGKQVLNKYEKQIASELTKLLPNYGSGGNGGNGNGNCNNPINNALIKNATEAIGDLQYKAFNFQWPKINSGANNTVIEINESQSFNHKINNIDWIVTWYMFGYLNISLQTQSGINNSIYYQIECQSQSIAFKFIVLKKDAFNSFDKQLSNKQQFNEMKQFLDNKDRQKIETLINKDNNKELTWDDF